MTEINFGLPSAGRARLARTQRRVPSPERKRDALSSFYSGSHGMTEINVGLPSAGRARLARTQRRNSLGARARPLRAAWLFG